MLCIILELFTIYLINILSIFSSLLFLSLDFLLIYLEITLFLPYLVKVTSPRLSVGIFLRIYPSYIFYIVSLNLIRKKHVISNLYIG